MARGFGSTLGVGSTDRIQIVQTVTPSHLVFSCWMYRNGAGGGSAGRIFDKQLNANFLWDNTNTRFQFMRNFSVANGTYVFNGNNITDTGRWIHVCISNESDVTDGTETRVWVDGTEVTVTRTVAPSGTLDTSTNPWYFGNRSDNLRNWDGNIAEIAFWSNPVAGGPGALASILAGPLAKGFSPLFFQNSLVDYQTWVRMNVSMRAAPATVVGTAVQPHPNIIYPASFGATGEAAIVEAARRNLMLLGVG
jgi:hypothetical protein